MSAIIPLAFFIGGVGVGVVMGFVMSAMIKRVDN